jgi:hypothetical protein
MFELRIVSDRRRAASLIDEVRLLERLIREPRELGPVKVDEIGGISCNVLRHGVMDAVTTVSVEMSLDPFTIDGHHFEQVPRKQSRRERPCNGIARLESRHVPDESPQTAVIEIEQLLGRKRIATEDPYHRCNESLAWKRRCLGDVFAPPKKRFEYALS